MNFGATTLDASGKIVRAGVKVRVISIDPGLIATLEPEEKPRVLSMIGEVLEVEEVTDSGYAMVEKGWRIGPDRLTFHTVALASTEMELVE